VLIMDEPSAGLDPLVQREFQAMMREVVADDRTVFLSSHTLSEVQRVADRVGIIRHGRLIALESVTDLRSKAMRRVELELDSPADASFLGSLRGVTDLSRGAPAAGFSYEGKMAEPAPTVAGRYEIVDIRTHEADLEEIFLTYYRDADHRDAKSPGAGEEEASC
jgi:ABC-2 type transport system ATP-binding protein